MNFSFWRGKNVLITGHTGFKGSWLTQILLEQGSRVSGLALEPSTSPNLFTQLGLGNGDIRSQITDIRDFEATKKYFIEINPEIVFHLAAQPLVLRSYEDPLGTFAVNALGTAHVIQAARACSQIRAFVSVTTDKVYENLEQTKSYREDDPLGGYDPYSASKACAEIVTRSFRRSFPSFGLASARAGNVIGGGDWSANRLLPDLFRSATAEQTLRVRNPHAVRPWQHVLEPLAGYLSLAQKLWDDPERFSQAFNFGPRDDDAVPVEQVIGLVNQMLPKKLNVQYEEARVHEAQLLKLDSTKAQTELGWRPRWTLKEALEKTCAWYLAQAKSPAVSAVRQMTSRQIQDYLNL